MSNGRDLLQDWSIGFASVLEVQNPFDDGKVVIANRLYAYFKACMRICEGESVCGAFFIKRLFAKCSLPTRDEILGIMPVVNKGECTLHRLGTEM